MNFRVLGYILKPKKEIFIALTDIFGIGKKTSLAICNQLSINPTQRVADVEHGLAIKLTEYISQHYTTSNDLKKIIIANKKKYIALNCYRGKRLRLGLPARGQKTRSNARTSRMMHKKLI